MNNVPRGMVIRNGSTVLVRRGDSAATAVSEHVINNAQLAYTPEIVLRRTTVRARRGDSVASLAARYDLPAATVAGWNRLGARAGLKRGQAVVLFLPVRAAAAAARDGVAAGARAQRSQRTAAQAGKPATRGRAATRSAGKPAARSSAKAAPARKSGSRAAPASSKKRSPGKKR